jgi:hypothetical protein
VRHRGFGPGRLKVIGLDFLIVFVQEQIILIFQKILLFDQCSLENVFNNSNDRFRAGFNRWAPAPWPNFIHFLNGDKGFGVENLGLFHGVGNFNVNGRQDGLLGTSTRSRMFGGRVSFAPIWPDMFLVAAFTSAASAVITLATPIRSRLIASAFTPSAAMATFGGCGSILIVS